MNYYKLLRESKPFLLLATIIYFLTSFLFRNISNFNHPLGGEFLTSPFHFEILKRSLSVWDGHFGLGFSNLMGNSGEAQYAAAYSGAMWVTTNTLNSLFQSTGYAYFCNQLFNLFLLGTGIYSLINLFQTHRQSLLKNLIFTIAILLIVHSTDYFIGWAPSAGRFPAGHGLLLIALSQYRRRSRIRMDESRWIGRLLPLALCLATLLLVFNPFFVAFIIFVIVQGIFSCGTVQEECKQTFLEHTIIIALAITITVLMYGYVMAPSFFSSATLISGVIGRHDSPMQYSPVDILRFFNNATAGHFSWGGAWLQSSLAAFGLGLALFKKKFKRPALIDLLSVALFIFLAKGSTQPYPEINHWLHVHVPLMKILGSGYPYLGIIYSIFIYYLVFGISCASTYASERLPRAWAYAPAFFAVLLAALAVFRNNAYLSGDFGGRVQPIYYPNGYYEFKNHAEREMIKGRAYYFPDMGARIGMDYTCSPSHPARPMDCCYDLPFSSVFPVNTSWSNFNKYSGYYGQTMQFLMTHVRNPDELAGIMADTGTRYLVFDRSLKSTAAAWPRMAAIRDLVRTGSQFVYSSDLSNPTIEVYLNQRWGPHVGPKRINELGLATDEPKIFLNEHVLRRLNSPGQQTLPSGAVTLENVLMLNQAGKIKYIFDHNSDETGMMLDLIHRKYEIGINSDDLHSDGAQSWFTYNQAYQIQDTAIHGGRFIGGNPIASFSGSAKANYYKHVSPNTRYRLFARAMVAPDSGRVLLSAGRMSRKLDLRSKGFVGIQWFDLGEITNASGNIRVQVIALDKGYLKRIDTLSLIPKTEFESNKRLMEEIRSKVEVVKIIEPEFLSWLAARNENKISFPATEQDLAIKPVNLSVLRHNFSLNEYFDIFSSNFLHNTYNLGPHSKHTATAPGLPRDRSFRRNYGGANPRYNASTDVSSGTYSLSYQLEACQPFSELTLDLKTAFLTKSDPVKIYTSGDAVSWALAKTLTSDGNNSIELSPMVRGIKRVFVKISHDKLNPSPNSILITQLSFHGVAGNPKMNCDLKNTTNTEASVTKEKQAGAHTSFRGDDPARQGEHYADTTGMNMFVYDFGYDKNWLAGNVAPINVGYGFSGFLTSSGADTLKPVHSWSVKYLLLIAVAAGSYLLLWALNIRRFINK